MAGSPAAERGDVGRVVNADETDVLLLRGPRLPDRPSALALALGRSLRPRDPVDLHGTEGHKSDFKHDTYNKASTVKDRWKNETPVLTFFS